MFQSLRAAMQDVQLYELVSKLKEGHQPSLSILYDRYAAALLGVIMKTVPQQETAEDLLQEVFVKIWQKAHQYQEEKGSFFTWMLNIARNHAIDYYRSKRFTQQSKTNTVEDYVHLKEAGGTESMSVDGIGLGKTLEQLPPEQRRIVYLTYYMGYTQDEISKTLDVPLGTVKSRLRLAMKKLSELLNMLLFWI